MKTSLASFQASSIDSTTEREISKGSVDSLPQSRSGLVWHRLNWILHQLLSLTQMSSSRGHTQLMKEELWLLRTESSLGALLERTMRL
jgi:hypothetical protein